MNDRDTLQRIMQVLGPSAVCACHGCAWETDEVIRLLREAGIEYEHRRAVARPPHEPEREQLGNAADSAGIPDFEKIARTLLAPLRDAPAATYDALFVDVAEQLRLVWNVRGAADVAMITALQRERDDLRRELNNGQIEVDEAITQLFRAVVDAYEGREVPEDLREHGTVQRALAFRAGLKIAP